MTTDGPSDREKDMLHDVDDWPQKPGDVSLSLCDLCCSSLRKQS